ncbi:MAG: hypothetical protein EA361_02480 [Bacteroidetes bacterium]|nr:MAG: hypothetical protein EA361_02480 [Bacteroidota bacterium]
MKLILTVLIFTFLSAGKVCSQTYRSTFTTTDRNIDIEKLADPKVIFLYDDFVEAKVYQRGKVSDAEINYRLLTDEVIIRTDHPGTIKSLYGNNLDSLITQDNRLIVFVPEIGFAEKIRTQTSRYFIKYQTNHLMTEMKPGAYGVSSPTSSTQPVRNIATDGAYAAGGSNYIHLENTTGNEVQVILTSKPNFMIYYQEQYQSASNRRELVRVLPGNYRSDINSFIRSENISFDNRDDLIKLAGFLDQLDY